MSITLNFHGIEVICDKPEEAMVLAGAASSLKLPKPADLAKLADKPIKLTLNGVELTCETPAAAAATLLAAGVVQRPKASSAEVRGAQGSGPSRAWKDAEEYGKKFNVSTDDARRLIAQKKREIRARMEMNEPLTKEDLAFQAQMKAINASDDDESPKKPGKKKK